MLHECGCTPGTKDLLQLRTDPMLFEASLSGLPEQLNNR